ncbi:MAG: trimethylamine methyltransferase family protein [Deltaproteobacteria bacterium]|nr:trimethylamine methyltransferase family protein [Deltaproteobacteria bacterium]
MDIWNLRGGQLRFLTDQQLREIHFAALDVLQRVGCFFDHEGALKIFEEAGARVDHQARVVRFPSSLVEHALAQTPDRIHLPARNPEYDIYAEQDRVYFGPGTLSIKVIDPFTGKCRLGTLQDARDFPRLIDALENIHFYKGMIHPSDVNQKLADLYMAYAAFSNTVKQISNTPYSTETALDMIRMGEILAGGMDEFRIKPYIILNMLAVSPLQWEYTNVDIIIELAKLGVPMIIGSEPQNGTTGPATLAGALVLNTAETLAGITLAELVSPGVPVMWGNVGSLSDMRTGLFASGAVELGIMNVAATQIAKFYRLPIYATGGMTDSKTSDCQAGYEKALQALLIALGGGNYIHDAAGLLESCLTSSYEQYVIDNEILGMVARVLSGIEVSRETLAVDVIEKVGPRGNFLGEMHTLRSISREHFIPKISNRQIREDWEKEGKKTVMEVAREKACQILNTHQVPPLPEDVDREFRLILEKAEEGYGRA